MMVSMQSSHLLNGQVPFGDIIISIVSCRNENSNLNMSSTQDISDDLGKQVLRGHFHSLRAGSLWDHFALVSHITEAQYVSQAPFDA
jgi:hypothetical protein